MSMTDADVVDAPLRALAQAIAVRAVARALKMLRDSPMLATASFKTGASRQTANAYFLDGIGSDTALHIAAASYQREIVRKLIAMGADVRARNRRGAEPLHAAAVGMPGSPRWNPRAQAVTVACLIEANADPNATDKNGATPLHRAVRTRCATAVRALLKGGSDARCKNKSGTTPMRLASLNSGRGGTGSAAAKAQQQEILRLLREHGATGKRSSQMARPTPRR